MRLAMQAPFARGAVHQDTGIALPALGAIDKQPFATTLTPLEVGRIQVLALAAQSPLAHRPRRSPIPARG